MHTTGSRKNKHNTVQGQNPLATTMNSLILEFIAICVLGIAMLVFAWQLIPTPTPKKKGK